MSPAMCGTVLYHKAVLHPTLILTVLPGTHVDEKPVPNKLILELCFVYKPKNFCVVLILCFLKMYLTVNQGKTMLRFIIIENLLRVVCHFRIETTPVFESLSKHPS